MSALRDALTEYVAVRRALGTQLREPAVTLGHFVGFLEREGAKFITTELAVRWALRPERVQPATRARLLSMVRKFAAWLSAFAPRTEVPPRGLIEARHRRQKPHIFTTREVEQLMAEAARLPSPTGLRALTHVTLIGLLAATGLRPGEAISLDVPDVDLQNGDVLEAIEFIHERAVGAVGLGGGHDDGRFTQLGDVGERDGVVAKLGNWHVLDGLEQACLVIQQEYAGVALIEHDLARGRGWLPRDARDRGALAGPRLLLLGASWGMTRQSARPTITTAAAPKLNREAHEAIGDPLSVRNCRN